MAYIPNAERYTQMEYRRCGRSGLKLPLLSMGLWHNFGDTNSLEHMAQLCETAFDGGITHFDLANNYGPPAGAAERNFGKLLKTIFAGHRDELVISTKAGYDMWEGPYGEWGSRKYLNHVGISRENCIAIGDGPNDLQMMEYAGISVAMGNAREEVKRLADMVTDHIDEDGILHAFERLGLINDCI